jgi:hypothetical protein
MEEAVSTMNDTSQRPRYCSNPACGATLIDPRPTDLLHEPPSINDLWLCGNCGAINVIQLFGTRLLSDEEFTTMPEDICVDLDFARRACKRNLRAN